MNSLFSLLGKLTDQHGSCPCSNQTETSNRCRNSRHLYDEDCTPPTGLSSTTSPDSITINSSSSSSTTNSSALYPSSSANAAPTLTHDQSKNVLTTSISTSDTNILGPGHATGSTTTSISLTRAAGSPLSGGPASAGSAANNSNHTIHQIVIPVVSVLFVLLLLSCLSWFLLRRRAKRNAMLHLESDNASNQDEHATLTAGPSILMNKQVPDSGYLGKVKYGRDTRVSQPRIATDDGSDGYYPRHPSSQYQGMGTAH